MLFSFLTWRITKVAFIVSGTLSIVFLFVQFIQLDQVLLKAPLKESALFLAVWLLYFFSYFLPSSLVVAFGWAFFELKESKKLNVVASFGKDPKSVFFKVFLLSLPFFFSVIAIGVFIKQEDISHLRKLFIYRYYMEILKAIPEKGFYTLGKVTIRVEERDDRVFNGVLLKIENNLISARQAVFQGEELVLKDGSFVVKRENKYYLTRFQKYTLNFSEILPREERKRRESPFLPVINAALAIIFTFLAFHIVIKLINRHTKLYYTLGFFITIHHLALILLRSKL
ncbi:LptF/LptG family permease [Thermocrinis sp.]